MSIVPKTIRIKAGDSLTNIAYEVLGDSSGWRELATMNDLNIFKALEIGQSLTIPDKDAAERRLKNIGARTVTNVNETIQNRVKQILDSREAKVISKLIGFDDKDRQQLLKDLDLSSIANNLNAPTKGERIRNALKKSSYQPDIPAWQLIEWVL